MSFPKRLRSAKHPDYPEAVFSVLANPTGKLYDALLMGDTSTDENSQALGAALVEAYAGGKVEAYGVTFDFSTPAAAILTLKDERIPIDLRVWLRNAPTDLVAYEREDFDAKRRASFDLGK